MVLNVNDNSKIRAGTKKKFLVLAKQLWFGRSTRWVLLGVIVYIVVLQHVFLQIAALFGITWPLIFWDTLIEMCEFFEVCTSDN